MSDQQDKYVNPKLVQRVIAASLPSLSRNLRHTVMALWAHCDSFLTKDDLDANRIRFQGRVSYQQIADYCGTSYKTAQRDCKRLRERQLFTWKVGRHWIDFTFRCGEGTEDEYIDIETGNQMSAAKTYTLWRPSKDPKAYGRPVKGGTARWVGGRCPDCRWTEEYKLQHPCLECFEEIVGERSENVTDLQWAVYAPDDEYNGGGYADEDVADDEQRADFTRRHRLMLELAKQQGNDADFAALWRGLSNQGRSK